MILKLEVRIKQENEVKIKLRIENGGHLSNLGGRRIQEHLKKLGRRTKMVSPSLVTSSLKRGRMTKLCELLEFKLNL